MKKKDDNKTIPYIAIAAVVMLLSIIIIYSLGKNAANMIISNTTAVADVFRYKRADGSIQKVSLSSDGATQGDYSSQEPSVSSNGRFVAFRSQATNLLWTTDQNGTADDIFVHDHGSLSATYAKPSWWNNNNCDSTWYNNHKTMGGNATLLTTWRGIQACGPGPWSVDPTHFWTGVSHTGTPLTGDNEWQCTELAKRYLYLAYGLARLSGDGNAVATNYYNAYKTTLPLEHVVATVNGSTRTVNTFPEEGSVISYGAVHVAIVTSVNVTNKANGNATITVMEQNLSANGIATDTISGWTYTAHGGLYVIDWITP